MKTVLIKPLVTEKLAPLAEKPKSKQYAFVVDRDANKVEIKKAIEAKYNVEVVSVNTIIMPSKPKMRITKGKMLPGRTAQVKKAVVTLNGEQSIDFYSNI